jgi:hypothetical protein
LSFVVIFEQTKPKNKKEENAQINPKKVKQAL